MKFSLSLAALTMATTVIGAYIPGENWSTYTPSSTLKGGFTSFSASFGIAIEPINTSGTSFDPLAKRDVVSQIDDGQIQATTSTASSVSTKKTTAAEVVSQISDGQVQATTTTTKAKTTAAEIVSQISDGQVQATTSTKSTAAEVVSQISDGQVQATTFTSSIKATASGVVSQISDGQVQATTSTSSTKATTSGVVSQISDGQAQASSGSATASASTSSASSTGELSIDSVACYQSGDLALTLVDGVLTDSSGRIGSIVANRQFQFDGPPPQAGAIYAAGWEISADGYLAIGSDETFWQCLSGTFYNLYDQSLGSQCKPVKLQIVEFTGDC